MLKLKNYKIFVTLLVLIIAKNNLAVPEDIKEQFFNAIQVCATESGVDSDKIQNFLRGEYETASHELKCFVNCFANKMSYIADGEPQIEEMKKSFEKLPNFDMKKFDKATEDCKSQYTGADECEKGFKYMTCRRSIMEN
ncbi:general odorant-binding protein 56d-like [Condylostylus longicornis]|uniref:general odorant-binding protein 56d-like n=1 Tax=Condylostylus longicornis TaxID=2530218 RepID=UPI00244E00C0|nr:general odorant-binding protein 56d-like [Condylostylus longicornis]